MESFVPIGPQLEGIPENFSLANMTPSFGEYFPAQAGNALRDSGASSIYRAVELAGANAREAGAFDEFGVYQPGPAPAARRVSSEYAKSRADDAGVKVDFGTSDYTEDAVSIMVDRARRRAVRDEAINAYDPSMLTTLGVSVAAGLVDPVNVASAFIPVVGEARYLGMLAGATSFGGRTAVRAGVGAAEGAAGAALLEPMIALAATQEGRDYTLADSMTNLLFGAGFGSGLHIAGGTFAEKVAGRTYASAPVVTPEDIVDRLPQEAKRQAMAAAIADVTEGRPVQAADVIDQLTAQDPELAKEVLYAQTLKRDGPDLDDTEARIAFWEGKISGKGSRKLTGKPEDFSIWVRGLGGVRDTDGALEGYLGKGHGLPPSLFITGRGSKRTQRGVDFEELYLRAVNEGFVTTKQEFIDAFRAQAGGVIAPIVRRSDSDVAERVREEADYVREAIAAAGVNPRASAKVRARAIVGREQHVMAAERARVAGALKRLEQRRADILKGETPQPAPKDELPEPEKLPKSSEEDVEVGDTVETADGEGKVSQVHNDPVYGKWVSVEGSDSAIEAGGVKITAKGDKPKDTLSAAIEQDKKTAKAEAAAAKKTVAEPAVAEGMVRLYHGGDAAVKDAPRWVSTSRTYARDYREGGTLHYIDVPETDPRITPDYPEQGPRQGFTFNFELSAEEATGLKALPLSVGKQRRPQTKGEKAKFKTSQNAHTYDTKFDMGRRILDEQFPNLAATGEYYYSAILTMRDGLEISLDGGAKWLRKAIKEGKVEVRDADTGKVVTTISSRYADIDAIMDVPDLVIKFSKPSSKPLDQANNPTPPRAKHAVNLGPLSPEENARVQADSDRVGSAREAAKLAAEKADADAADMAAAGPRSPMPDSPPAERSALSTKELKDINAQTKVLEAKTLKRLDSMIKTMSPEVAATIRAQLAKIDADSTELAKLYESAVLCLLKP